MPLFLYFPHTYCRHPNNPWPFFCHFPHHSASPPAAVPHPLMTCLIYLYLQRHHHHTRRRLYVPIIFYTPLENLGIPSLSLRATSLFPKIFCACRSNFSPLISACSSPLWSLPSVLLAPIYFAYANLLYFAHSDMLFYLRASLIAPLCSNLLALPPSNLLALPLSASFLSILLYSHSIVSDHSPKLCLLYYIFSVSSMLIYDWSAHSPLWLLRSVMLARIRSAWLGSVCISSLSSALYFPPLNLLIFIKITYH